MQTNFQQSIVQLYNVTKTYSHNSKALDDINLAIEYGEFVFLTGPSGAGKTTLLKLLFAEEAPTSGQIIVLGRNLNRIKDTNIHQLRRQVGVVFQDFKLLKNRTVFSNIDFVLRLYGHPKRERERRAWQSLKMVGLEQRLGAYPLELSGGEQQRIAIARAIVNNPPLILADEPTGNLDTKKEEEIMDLFNQINKNGTTLMIATHNDTIIKRMGKRVVFLDNGKLTDYR